MASLRKMMLPVICFTPQNHCANLLVQHINQLTSSLKVQSYTFTSKKIGRAIIAAYKRGVKVQMIFDKSQFDCQHYSYAGKMLRQGIPMRVDVKPTIAHNKVMLGDHTWVETGSFNYTYSAQHKNAENLLFLTGNRSIAAYQHNFQNRWQQSIPIIKDPCWFHRYSYYKRKRRHWHVLR